MTRFKNRQDGIQCQRGFSLIEAMFSALILAIALLALAGFHVGAFQDGSVVKSRMAATTLAQEKLDDLRSFTRLQDDPATTGVDECAAGTFCFSEIATGAGGKEKTDGTLELPAGAVSNGYQETYTLSWTVTCATSETAGSVLSFGTTCTNAIAKLATVSIAWTDNKGATQTTRPAGTAFNSVCGTSAPYTCHSVTLQSVIYSMDPGNGAMAAVSPSGNGPKIKYTPNNDSVPIEIGGGKSTETSKPLPEVSGGDSRRVTLPSVVYTGSSGSETVVTREEFATVNCTCNLKSTQETAWTPHRTVWNGSALAQEKGELVTKVVGQPSDLSNNGTTNQDPLCIECCRDHHDTNSDLIDGNGAPDYPAYRPYIDPSQFSSTTGDHKHFKLDGTEATLTTDVYVEACRMKRVDGFWRVAADWRLIELAAYGCDYFVDTPTDQCPPSATPVTSKLDTYKDWVKAVLKSFVGYLGTNQTADTTSAALPAFSSGVAPLLDINESSDDINVLYGGNKQLITRGIYADVVFKTKESGYPRQVDTDYVAAVLPVYSASNFDKLQYLPFYDANLTLLAKWSPTSTNANISGSIKYGDCSQTALITYDATPTPSSAICVTSEAIDTIDDPTLDYYDDFYSRGKLYGKATSGSTLITASVARGNNGLTSSPSINGATDSVQARQVRASISGLGISGKVRRGNSSADLSKVTITPSPSSGVSCAFTNPSTLATASAADYSCTVPSGGWTGTLTFGDTDTATTYSFSPSATTATLTAPVIVPEVVAYGEAVSLYGKVYYTGSTDTKIAITTSTGQTCTISGQLVTCAGLPLSSGTWSGTVTLANKPVCGSGSTLCTNNLDVETLANPITTANDCTSGDGTGAKTTGTLATVGKADIGTVSAPTAFTFCAK